MAQPDENLAADLHAYLRTRGWDVESTGPIGSMWRCTTGHSAGREIGVPARVARESYEFRGVVDRLSHFEGRKSHEVERNILYFGVDIAYLRAANDVIIADTIPLTAGATMIETARTMLRSSATTAQRPRAEIGGNYSRIGDGFANEVRMGHTEQGSYIIPVMVRVGAPDDERDDQDPLTGLDERAITFESAERRVTRTFAESFDAVVDRIITPGREPRKADIHGLISAGASREFISALVRILSEPAVAEFEARFDWAESQRPPDAVPKSITAPSEAADLLVKTARLMRAVPKPRFDILTGPIVQVRHERDNSVGFASIRTVRNGRPCEVRVWLKGGVPLEVHQWMNSGRTVLVHGTVERAGASGLNIRQPQTFGPLDETFLDSPEDAVT